MIIHKEGLFHLCTDHYSYLFSVDRFGCLQHLHFGAPVRTEDAAAFHTHPGLGWGSCTVLSDRDSGSCLDDKPLEWSSSGRGDYRESPIELCGAASDFRYQGFRILEGTAPMECGLPQAFGAPETLEITLEQSGARLTLYYTAFETALVRRAVLENTGESSFTLNKLMSMSMDIPGNFVVVRDRYGFDYHYYHMVEESKEVVEGQIVKQGDVIGLVGNTGNSASDHLHLAVISPEDTYINPYDMFLEAGIGPIKPRMETE